MPYLKKPLRLLSLLNEESTFPNGTDYTFANNLRQHLNWNPCFRGEQEKSFTVSHFAGEVTYDTIGFLEKNRDLLHLDSIQLLSSSSCHLPQAFASNMLNQSEKPVVGTLHKAGGADSQKLSAATKFKGQLFQLMQRLESTTPHFIRCIKPNNFQSPGSYEQGLVLQQLRCCGVLEFVRISRSGFPTRMSHQKFARRYGFLLVENAASQDPFSVSVAILHQFNILPEMYQVGYTKLFFRTGLGFLRIQEIILFLAFYVFKAALEGTELAATLRSFKEELPPYTIRGCLVRRCSGDNGFKFGVSKKEEENDILHQRLLQYENRWSEYELKMKSMEEVWKKQMRSLQSSLSIAKNSLAVDESERSSDASVNTSDDREYRWDAGSNLKVSESNGLRSMSAGLNVISRLAEEFEQKSQIFGDDAKFLVEVKSGQVDASLNQDRELQRLKQMFETWKKDCASRLRETKVVLNKLGSEEGALDKLHISIGNQERYHREIARGKVLRVYIPNVSNKPKYRIHTFAFVLFKKEEGLRKAIMNINGTWIDGKRAFVGVVKYQNHRSRLDITSKSKKEEKKVNKGETKRRNEGTELLGSLRDERSYKDVLVYNGRSRDDQVLKDNNVGREGRVLGIRNVWEMHIPSVELDWVKRSLTGIIKPLFDLELVQKGLASDGINVKIASWGYAWNSCIVTFSLIEELAEMWSKKKEELLFWFKWLEPLLNEEDYWPVGLKSIQESTVKKMDMSVARALLRVASPFDVPETITLGSYGRSFKVKIELRSVYRREEVMSEMSSEAATEGENSETAAVDSENSETAATEEEEEEEGAAEEVGRPDLAVHHTSCQSQSEHNCETISTDFRLVPAGPMLNITNMGYRGINEIQVESPEVVKKSVLMGGDRGKYSTKEDVCRVVTGNSAIRSPSSPPLNLRRSSSAGTIFCDRVYSRSNREKIAEESGMEFFAMDVSTENEELRYTWQVSRMLGVTFQGGKKSFAQKGLGRKEKVRVARRMIVNRKPLVLFLQETKVEVVKPALLRSLGEKTLRGIAVSPTEGTSGGGENWKIAEFAFDESVSGICISDIAQILLPMSLSDHNAVVWERKEVNWGSKPFKLFNYLMNEDGFQQMMELKIKEVKKPALKEDILKFFEDFYLGKKLRNGVNHTFITLIPKKPNPVEIEDYRAISLVGGISHLSRGGKSTIALLLRMKASTTEGKKVEELMGLRQKALRFKGFTPRMQSIAYVVQFSRADVFPTEYLGLPLGYKRNSKVLWESIIHRFYQRLAGWKSSTLSLADDIFSKELRNHLLLQVGKGNSIRFWQDEWIDILPLRLRFPRLFALSVNKDGFITEFVSVNYGRWVCDIQMRINLFDWEISLGCVSAVLEDVECWCPPTSGWFKVNVDVAVGYDWRSSGIGGLVRDSEGNHQGSFSVAAGPVPLVLAKLKAIKAGLNMFLDSKWKDKGHLILESDSLVAVNWIKNPECCLAVFSILVISYDCVGFQCAT
ncbi:Myosin-1 [Hibiscus syriacus]|uniref:Myosin-1 n=1 Tax=Hibiscus syriacus TaxID=106335 RepID=A0A6A2Y2S2_HIBSY|nr:Myosin-1 [Hibiscus syriacus]